MLRNTLLLLVIIFHSSIYAESVSGDFVKLEANEAPPFWSESLAYSGMCGEIIHEMSKAGGVNTTIEFKPLTRLIEDDTNNDLGNPGFFIINQDFSKIIPIAIYHIAIYQYVHNHEEASHNSHTHHIASLDDLKGKRVGLIKGALQDYPYFKRKGVLFEASYSQESLFKKLKLGRLDYVIEVEIVADYIIGKLFPLEKEDFISIHIAGSASPIAIMLAQEQPNVEAISKKYTLGLKEIIDNGVYQNILKKYYDKGSVPDNWLENLQKFNLLYTQEED